jgi:hypothetical protein
MNSQVSDEILSRLATEANQGGLTANDLVIELLDSDTFENARAEYAATQDAALHYDNYSWQVGAVLFAGVFVYWGFLIDKDPGLGISLVGDFFIVLILSIWVLYVEHNRQIALFKLHRARELERLLKMSQHQRFHTGYYHLNSPRGHHLDFIIYVFIAAGGPTLSVIKHHSENWACRHLTILIMIAVLMITIFVWSLRNDWEAKSSIRQKEDPAK